MQVGGRGSERACDFRVYNSAPYLRCPSYQLSRWLRQDSPSGSRGGHLVAVCLGSSPWFGSCIHNSPCQYKSHCRRPAFACSPSHRSLSTEKRGGQEMTFQTFPVAATISPHPPYQVCPPVGAAECSSYLSVEAFISGHSRFCQTLPKLGLPQAGTSKPFFLWGSQRIWIPMCQTHPFCASKTVPQTHDMWRGKGPTANM